MWDHWIRAAFWYIIENAPLKGLDMTELPWPVAYRPRKLSEVVGQLEAVEAVRRRIVPRKRLGPIILEGPSGSGKTTLARILAKAMQCELPTISSDACDACEPCLRFDAGSQPDFHEIDGALQGTTATIRELIQFDLTGRPFSAPVRVVFIDEADNLTEKAQSSLLKPVEQDSAYQLFIFSLVDADKLFSALRARCTRVRLLRPNQAEAITYLEQICASEAVQAEQAALWLIAARAPSFRDLAATLEEVAHSCSARSVTVAAVRSALRRGKTVEIVKYLEAAIDGDIDAQLDALQAAMLSSSEKAAAILELLTYIKITQAGPVRSSKRHSLDLLLEDDERERIVKGLSWRAEVLGTDLARLLHEALEFWSFLPLRLDEAVLAAQAARFSDLLMIDRYESTSRSDLANRMGEARRQLPFQSTSAQRKRALWRDSDNSNNPREHLSAGQVQELYEAATFLVQRYRATFNACLTLPHSALGIDTEKLAIDLVADISRELGMRLHRWAVAAGEPEMGTLHRLSLLERKNSTELESTILFHLPAFATEKARRWIVEKFLPRRASELLHCQDWLEIDVVGDRRGALAVHWELMRRIWRGTDPAIMADGVPLVDRLNVPVRHRRNAGSISRRRFSISASLGPSARAEEANLLGPHLSAFADGAWGWMFKGWELRLAAERMQARSRLAEQLQAVSKEVELSGDPLSHRQLAFQRRLAIEEAKKTRNFNTRPWISDQDEHCLE